MRVLLVHNFYQVPGGEDSVVREELAMLKQNGIEVELLSVNNDAINWFGARLATGVQTIYSPWGRRTLARKIAQFGPDVVHIHNFFPLLSPSIFDACRDAGVPTVMTLHNFRILSPSALLHPAEKERVHNLRSSCWWTVPKKVYRNSLVGTLTVAAMIEFHKRAGTWNNKVDRFIALTESAKRTFIAGGLPAERIVIKPNFTTRPAQPGGAKREGGLFVGRLDEQKGLDTLLRAWRDIDYPLKIIGDGPLSRFVQENASDRIIYFGRQPRDAVQKEMQAAKFLVLPSRGQEMFPMTVVEAFANGLPVICSGLTSLAELVGPSTGLVFPPEDAGALAAQVRWAISNPSAMDELGARARVLYEERYTPEANFRQLLNIYLSACRDRAHLRVPLSAPVLAEADEGEPISAESPR